MREIGFPFVVKAPGTRAVNRPPAASSFVLDSRRVVYPHGCSYTAISNGAERSVSRPGETGRVEELSRDNSGGERARNVTDVLHEFFSRPDRPRVHLTKIRVDSVARTASVSPKRPFNFRLVRHAILGDVT